MEIRSDAELVRAARRGDRQAFGEFVLRLRSPLIGFLAARVRGRDDAEELAQEALLRAWQKLDQLRDDAACAAWVFRIAANLASRVRANLAVPLTTDVANPADAEPDERLAALGRAIAELGEAQRDVIYRKHFNGTTTDEIAQQLGVPAGTVRSRLSRAYAELRGRLERERLA